MPWTAIASRWTEIIDGPYTGADKHEVPLVWGEIWLLDLPARDDAGGACRGILLRRIDGEVRDEPMREARRVAAALAAAESLAAEIGGAVDYARFVQPAGGGIEGRVLVGAELADAWHPGDGATDFLAHLRHPMEPDDVGDIPFPPSRSGSP